MGGGRGKGGDGDGGGGAVSSRRSCRQEQMPGAGRDEKDGGSR